MSIKNIVFLIVSLSLFSCDPPVVHGSCNCASTAVTVKATDALGNTIQPDTVFYQFNDTSSVDTITADSITGLLYADFGYEVGNYKVWSIDQGIRSDTARVQVVMGGPSNCRTLSTQGITFVFDADNTRAPILTKIGGCGE